MKQTLLKYGAAIAALLLAVSSCEKKPKDDGYTATEGLCLISEGRTVHKYDPLTWQVGFNRKKKEFRVHNDSMSEFYTLSCDEIPTEPGQEVTGNMTWSGSTSIVYRKNLCLEVKRVEDDGRIWLWCSKYRIAVSVQAL